MTCPICRERLGDDTSQAPFCTTQCADFAERGFVKRCLAAEAEAERLHAALHRARYELCPRCGVELAGEVAADAAGPAAHLAEHMRAELEQLASEVSHAIGEVTLTGDLSTVAWQQLGDHYSTLFFLMQRQAATRCGPTPAAGSSQTLTRSAWEAEGS